MGVHYYILPLLYMFENFNNKLCKKTIRASPKCPLFSLWLPCEMKNYYFLVTSVTEVPREDLSSHKSDFTIQTSIIPFLSNQEKNYRSHTSKKQLRWDFQREHEKF